MDADRARRAHAIFTSALDAPRSERGALVAAACAGDAALEARVRRLLEAAGQSTGFLETPALSMRSDAAPIAPDAVGNYLVVGVLGSGGMATVYEAVQESPSRRVAVKVMHHSLTRTDALLRFRLESQTLARLRHPGIAQIYEAGTAQLGQPSPSPFFAMELVPDALSLTEYARKHNLPLEARLTIFASVCDAVTHGHQNGIIHRDLKPANVLVGPDGIPKVIDFGIARSTSTDSPALTRTADAQRLIGTLNYMSPEQCDPRASIDFRVDAYSLGIILYELIYGHLPHDLSKLPIPAAVQRIVNDPPRQPAMPRGHRHRDLWAIVLKAIEKQPERRYQSVAALAADVRRLLNFQAIEARPPGFAHQFRLFARRHRALVAASLTLGLGVMLLAAVSTVFALRLSREVDHRQLAEQQVIRERDAARWQAYVAQMSGALSALKADEFEQLRTRLAAVEYQPRGWEWGFLSRLADRSTNTVEAHSGLILDFASNSDQSHFVTSSDRGAVRLWDDSFEQPLASFESESGARMFAAAFTADNRSVVCGDELGAVRLLDALNLRELSTVVTMSAAVRTIVPLSNIRVAIAAADGSAVVVDLETRRGEPIDVQQPGGIQGLAVSPDNTLLASFNDQGTLWLRTTSTLAPDLKVAFPGRINMVRFSGDSKKFAATGEGGRVLVWDTASGTLLRDFQVTQGINSVHSIAISHDGSMLAAGLVHRDIFVYSLVDGSMVGKLGGHTDSVSGLMFRSQDSLLTSTSYDRTIRQWRTSEIANPTGISTLTGHRDYVRAIAISPDSATIASASQDGDLRFWNPNLRQPIATLTVGNGPLLAVDYSPDGQVLAVGCNNGTVQLRDACTGLITRKWTDAKRRVTSLAFDPTGQRLAVGTEAGTVLLWDTRTGTELQTLLAHTARINSVAFSPDGSVLASGSRDGDVRLWSTSAGTQLHRLAGHTSDVFAVLFAPDGRLFSGSRDRSVLVWDTFTGSRLATLAGHGQYVTCLALSPDATRLAAGSWFGEIVLFDVASLDQIASFRGHDAAIRGLRFTPDGRWLASCSYDSTIRLFDSATRADADAVAQHAAASFANALLSLDPPSLQTSGDPATIVQRLRERGSDPAQDPWLRNAVLSMLAPTDPPWQSLNP